MTTETPKYAVIDTTETFKYRTLAHSIAEAFATQIQTMLEPAVKEATQTLTRNLLDKVDEGKYSRDFTALLQDSIVKALNDQSMKVSDADLSRRWDESNRLYEVVDDFRKEAQAVGSLLRDIQMSGNPDYIKAVVDFVRRVAVSSR